MIRISAIGLITLSAAGLCTPAYAQFWRDDNFLPKLTHEDKAFAQKAAREDMNGKEPGAVVAWTNPETGNSGTVRLVRNFTWQDNKCRQVVHAFNVKNVKQQEWQMMLCHMKDGAWKWPEPPKRLK